MELKDYQQDASEQLDRWLRELTEARVKSEEATLALAGIWDDVPGTVRDFPENAWKNLRTNGYLPDSVQLRDTPYHQRTTDLGDPLPHVCLKIPTGGGKTLMGAVAVERILANRVEQTGLVLWIVPTRAIYAQTRAALWNREHPYRQRLELASGGRVKVMEKDDRFSIDDVRNHLCVMLLMLPATNKMKNKDFLRMFRDAGNYEGFFPEDGNALAEGEFGTRHPSLEREGPEQRVKHSLFNVFKLMRPIVILDEAHKAYGKNKGKAQEYAHAISRMDPSVVVELSATPNANISNLLVDVTGKALQDEQMIKLPIQVRTTGSSTDWRHALSVARERLESLADAAGELESDSGRYIRPIAVVRAENTGRSLRDGVNIHVEDVRDELINQGVAPEAIRVKSSENDELGREDLINERERSAVTWILTKDALKEGWDCPFAYVLVLLDNTKAKTAITQMVGRVMRMPHVEFTGVDELDQCYVICHNADVRHTVDYVRAGLQEEGMEDLGSHVNGADPSASMTTIHVKRRQRFRGREIYLPSVLHKDSNGELRDLDYDRDIMAEIDWRYLRIDNPQPVLTAPASGGFATVGLGDDVHDIQDYQGGVSDEIDIGYFTRHLSHLVPNPWVCASVVRSAMYVLLSDARVDASHVNARRSTYAESYREALSKQIDHLAFNLFRGKFHTGDVVFDLTAHEANYELAEGYDEIVLESEQTLATAARSIQRSLFETVLLRDFNELERKFALYMDSKNAITWWHRVAASQRSGYYLRGWRRDRVFPDFVAMSAEGGRMDAYRTMLLVFETKGAHLAGNEDTEYKKKLLGLLQDAYNGDLPALGHMKIREGEPRGKFRMVMSDEIELAFEGTPVAKP